VERRAQRADAVAVWEAVFANLVADKCDHGFQLVGSEVVCAHIA
jgi:hypothetical protein